MPPKTTIAAIIEPTIPMAPTDMITAIGSAVKAKTLSRR